MKTAAELAVVLLVGACIGLVAADWAAAPALTESMFLGAR